ncbi:MAG: formylglycine-generating enzyme family protein [Verrucomicrobiota bacterium]
MPLEGAFPEPFPPDWAQGFGEDRYGVFVELYMDTVEFRLRWIPPGTFLMGSPDDEPERIPSEGPQHRVTISAGFWLMDTLVTQAQWEALMPDNPSRFPKDRNEAREALPVDSVTWHQAEQYAVALRQQLPGVDCFLPSEAQWEYACRAGTATPFHFGSSLAADQANFNGNFPYGGADPGPFRGKTTPVGSFGPNRWGLCDMHGNVWEWCRDGPREYQAGAFHDPVGPSEVSAKRCLRGGSWISYARYCRSAYRDALDPGFRFDRFGFRLAVGQAGGGADL